MAIKRKHIKAIIQLRRASEEEWLRADPILRLGEPAYSTDVYKLKVGDGIHHWHELVYLTANELEEKAKIRKGTTYDWNNAIGFVPVAGEIIVYIDYIVHLDENEEEVYEPGIKIGDGNTYVQDLPFVGDDLRRLITGHMNDTDIHITSAERTFWNNKINVNNAAEVINGALIFNRN